MYVRVVRRRGVPSAWVLPTVLTPGWWDGLARLWRFRQAEEFARIRGQKEPEESVVVDISVDPMNSALNPLWHVNEARPSTVETDRFERIRRIGVKGRKKQRKNRCRQPMSTPVFRQHFRTLDG